MPDFRKIFPSYDWDDAWLVNQIINLPYIMGKANIGFVKNVENEVAGKSEEKVAKWITEQMDNCSCLIVFVGEKTYSSEWVKFEMELAKKRGMGRFIVYLDGKKRQDGTICKKGIDPYNFNGFYSASGVGYVIESYSWEQDDGINNISDWIEDALSRTDKYS